MVKAFMSFLPQCPQFPSIMPFKKGAAHRGINTNIETYHVYLRVYRPHKLFSNTLVLAVGESPIIINLQVDDGYDQVLSLNTQFPHHLR